MRCESEWHRLCIPLPPTRKAASLKGRMNRTGTERRRSKEWTKGEKMSKGIEITEINVHPVKNKVPNSPLEAFVRVVLNDQIVINSIRVVKGKFGLFVSFP